MTKFILHGGYSDRENPNNDLFFEEILKDVPDNTSILLVYFAKEKEEWKQKYEIHKSAFLKAAGNKKLTFEVASEESFMDQIKSADVIYMHGGKTPKLLKVLQKFSDFAKTLVGKIIAGESAGAYALSTYYHSASVGGAHKGLGVLPVKVICHYQSDKHLTNDDPIELMNEYPENLELVVLKDYEWRTFVV